MAVRLAYQRRGIASRLLRWGVDIADREGIHGWLVAVPAAVAMYEKAGWQTVLKPPLDTPDLKVGANAYMLRKPKADKKGLAGVVDQDTSGTICVSAR